MTSDEAFDLVLHMASVYKGLSLGPALNDVEYCESLKQDSFFYTQSRAIFFRGLK